MTWRLFLLPMLVFLLFCGFDGRAAGLADSNQQYQRLEEALERYRRIADSGGWPSVPDGPTIEPGSRDPRLAALALRLAISGDLNNDARQFLEYDEELQAAVLRFQARHGLEQDALVGPATRRALNVMADVRVEQIRLNLDRARQVFRPGLEDFVLINVPAFKAYLNRDGRTVWETRIVVGEREAETPLFDTQIKLVILNPTWTVPYKIASRELLPKIKNDPGFISRGNYEVRDRNGNPVDPGLVDWATLNRNNFPYTLVQRAGPLNELGKIKFIFPNEYDVCMHDTPKKHLFAQYSRAYSHGCIRMDKPVDFAEMVLARDGWDRERIDKQLEAAHTQTVRLNEPLPLIIAYLTAAVDEAGNTYFYPDIYSRDTTASR